MAADHSHHYLFGSCSCGRNQFEVNLPESELDSAEIHLDNSAASRRAHAAPLTAYLSIPLAHYHSTTHAYYPDETHRSIRRTYDLPFLAHVPSTAAVDPASLTTHAADTPYSTIEIEGSQQRTFCGFCGTHFSVWDDTTSQRAGRMQIAVESLDAESTETLVSLGLLDDSPSPPEEEAAVPAAPPPTRDTDADGSADDLEEPGGQQLGVERQGDATTVTKHSGGRGAPWFEEMVEDSRLGRIRRVRGGREDAGVKVEYSVVEIDGSAKRKADDLEGDREDVSMS